MPPHANSVLQTKLRRPAIMAGLLPRPRLLAQLDAAADCTLTLVTAPAGSGKTSLVCQWLERCPLPAAWLQLDASDSEPALFFTYAVHALRRIAPDFGAETAILLQSARLPPFPILARTLSNEIEQLCAGQPCLLVLDDYHLVQNPALDRLLGDFVLRPPHGFHMVVTSRQAPSWPLGKLRLENRLLQLGTADLRFTAEETAAYLRRNNDSPLPDAAVARLQQQTEGWAAGLQLAVLALQQTHDAEAVLALHEGFVGSDNRYLLEYMADEVLRHLPAGLLDFMQATAICSRFNAPLCVALTGLPLETVREHLRCLQERNLFVIALPGAGGETNGTGGTNGVLGDGRNWRRYHHLMQQILLDRLQEAGSPEELAGLHARAAAWLGAHGYVDEALEHLAAVEDWDGTARLLLGQLDNALNTEDRHTLEHWLGGVPDAEIACRPALLLLGAWSSFFNLDLARLGQILNMIHEISGVPPPFAGLPAFAAQGWTPQFDGHIAVLRGLVHYFRSDAATALAAAETALALLPGSSSFAQKNAYFCLATAMQFGGRSAAAQELLLEAYRREQPKRTQGSARLLFNLSSVRLFSGELDAAGEAAQLLLQETRGANLALLEGWAHDTLGRIDYERNRLESAAAHFASLRRRCYAIHRGCAYDGFAGSLLLAAAQGNTEEVAVVSEEWRAFEQALWGLPTPLFYSAQARAALLVGDVDAARRWAATFRDPLPPAPMVWLETSHITKVHCLLAAAHVSGAPEDRAEAQALAAACLAQAERTHNLPAWVQLTALSALLLDAEGARAAACALLASALAAAAPAGFVRTFVDLGAPMADLLRTVKERALAGYVATLLRAFPPSALRGTAPGTPAAGGRIIFKDMPAATLTEREMEVLALLATPLSLQEIGDKLYISYSTVRQHTAHIYEKLGVSKRRHAVLLAAELGLLPKP